jgi:hypothetical protein
MIGPRIENCRRQHAVAINRMLKRRDHLILITDISGQARGDPALAADRIGELVQLVRSACQHVDSSVHAAVLWVWMAQASMRCR